MTWKPYNNSPAEVLSHDIDTTIYGYRVEVINVDTASDMVTYEDIGMGMTRTVPRVEYLGLIGKVDEENALRPWWNQYKDGMES